MHRDDYRRNIYFGSFICLGFVYIVNFERRENL
jgi:hypothetical protein